MRQLFIALWLCFVTEVVFGQDDKMEADRPTEAQATQTVSKGTLQAEIGFLKEHKAGPDFSLQYPDAVFRYGLLKNIELRLRTTLEAQRYHSKAEFDTGLKPLEVGVKAGIFKTKDTSFSLTLYGHLGLPQLASKDHQHHTTFYTARVLLENKLSKKIKLNYNVGRVWDDEQKDQNWMYALAPQFALSNKWDLFLEEYAYINRGGKPEHYVDGGLAYTIRSNIQVDVDAGKGFTETASDYFLTAGIIFKL